jgi:hypothetical protein
MARFDIHLDTLWKAPLLIIGATQARSWVEVGDQEIELKFGLGHEIIPLAEVADVAPHEWSLFYGIGHRIGPDGPAFVGSTKGVVEIKLKVPHTFHLLLGIKADYRSFYVSVDQPEAFMAAVRDRLRARGG